MNTYIQDLLAQSKQEHQGVFITGPSQIELLKDSLPQELYGDDYIITASIGNCRCASDGKAIKQFSSHARVPNNARKVALGHETVQIVLQAPKGLNIHAGDVVFITPGHSAVPVNPSTFELDLENGVLPSLGYSYQYLGGLRQFNAVPVKAIAYVQSQGFGNLFNRIDCLDATGDAAETVSLASLAHAEPYACCYGTNKHLFTCDATTGAFQYGVPATACLAYLGGTARMAMINVTIVAEMDDADLPRVIYITGSPSKLTDMQDFLLIKQLRSRGVHIELIDRSDQNIVAKLTEHGRPDIVWTNFASQELYDQATAIIAEGGNINNYAGASDPDIGFVMDIPAVNAQPIAEEVAANIHAALHVCGLNDFHRQRGVQVDGVCRFIGFADDEQRLNAYIQALPQGVSIVHDAASCDPAGRTVLETAERYTDVFIAGTGDAAATTYAALESELARDAAVVFVDGATRIHIRSRISHYTTRHQICGQTVPWYMTNTSEPHSDDMGIHAKIPTNFDWMIKGVVGLKHATEMMDSVEKDAPFGSFFTFNQLPDLPWVLVSAAAFRSEAAKNTGMVQTALNVAADVLEKDNDVWSVAVERSLYQSFGVVFPLDVATQK